MIIDEIFRNNTIWIKEHVESDSEYFRKMNKGQNPEILYIGCSDSRVSAEEIMGLGPGDLFVHRNISNVVNAIDLNTQSVINYAVTQLEVDHVVVCGHYSCGGVKAAMQAKDLGILNPWLRNIRDVYRMYKTELDAIGDISRRYDRLVELNVIEQAINVVKLAAVQKAIRNRGMKIHGWVFDIQTGKLIDLQFDFPTELEKIMDIYRLDE